MYTQCLSSKLNKRFPRYIVDFAFECPTESDGISMTGSINSMPDAYLGYFLFVVEEEVVYPLLETSRIWVHIIIKIVLYVICLIPHHFSTDNTNICTLHCLLDPSVPS